MSKLYCEEGDLFGWDVDQIIKDADFKVYGQHWKLWGKWVYDESIGLIALFSKSLSNGGAYAIRKGYEEIATPFSFGSEIY